MLVGVVVYSFPTFAVKVLTHLTVAAAILMTLHTCNIIINTAPFQGVLHKNTKLEHYFELLTIILYTYLILSLFTYREVVVPNLFTSSC